MFQFIISLLFMVLFWVWATEYFLNNENKKGWFYLFVSALNGANILTLLF